jgi:hypothetical protein
VGRWKQVGEGEEHHTLRFAGSELGKEKNMHTLWVAGSGLGWGKNVRTLLVAGSRLGRKFEHFQYEESYVICMDFTILSYHPNFTPFYKSLDPIKQLQLLVCMW